MAAALTLILTFLVAGVIWLGLGSRLPLNEDQQANELWNLLVYYLLSLPLVFVVVFFVVG